MCSHPMHPGALLQSSNLTQCFIYSHTTYLSAVYTVIQLSQVLLTVIQLKSVFYTVIKLNQALCTAI